MAPAQRCVPASFDAAHVCEQLGIPASLPREDVFSRYCAARDPGVNAHRAFDAGWYLWQNPHAARASSPFEHYLATDPAASIDPAPWIDTTLLKRQLDHEPGPGGVLDIALRPGWRAEHGVTAGSADLCRVQRSFLNQVAVSVIRPPLAPSARRQNLVWVQHGPESNFLKWFQPEEARSWDLAMNWYTGEPDPSVGDIILHQRGTKFSGIFSAARRLPGFFDGYDSILFVDDDLTFAHGDIDRLLEIANRETLDLFQASVEANSYCVWPALFHQGGTNIRETTSVEIMAPGFSGPALRAFLPSFSLSISGFGLDLLVGQQVRARGGRCAVVDTVQMSHHAAIDQSGGAYYEYLRSHGINSKYELWQLIQRFELGLEISEIGQGK